MTFKRIQFEVTNNCNMSCLFCPNKDMKRARTFLNAELFKNIINEISEKKITNIISFSGNGEPLLDDEIEKKLKYCKSKNLKTAVTTNGLLLKKLSKDTMSNIDKLYISWQTFNKKTFVLRGIKYDYDTYENKLLQFLKKNIEIDTHIYISLMQIRSQVAQKKELLPNICKTLASQNNEDLKVIIEKILKIIPNQKINTDILEKLKNKSSLINENHLGSNIFINIDEFFDWGGNLNDYSKEFIRIKATEGYCKIMMSGPLILANGDVSICCQDADGDVTVGNLNHKSLTEILSSEKYQLIYNNFKNKKIIMAHCQKCKGKWKNKNKLKNISYKINSIFTKIEKKLKKYLCNH